MCVVGIGQDITAHLAQEKECSKSIDNAHAPIFGVNTQGCVNIWNKCTQKIVGYTLEEVMGQNFVKESISEKIQMSSVCLSVCVSVCKEFLLKIPTQTGTKNSWSEFVCRVYI